MDFGIFLPNYGPLSSAQAIKKVSMLADNLGFQFLAICDHIFVEPEAGRTHINAGAVDAYPDNLSSANWLDAITTLGYVSALTEHVKLLTNIYLLPLRHPLVSARSFTTLDSLSNGRVILGIGVGWFKKEYDVLGVNWSERGKINDEYVEAMKVAWKQDVSSFAGKYVRFENVHFYPKPIQKPHPPFWVGGYVNDGIKIDSNPNVLRRVARIADAWVPSVAAPDELVKGIDLINEFCREIGRQDDSVRVVSQHLTSISKDDSHARSKAEVTLTSRFGSFDHGLEKNLVGSPDRITKRIQSYMDAGATDFLMGFISRDLDEFLSDMRTFARDVIPSFRR